MYPYTRDKQTQKVNIQPLDIKKVNPNIQPLDIKKVNPRIAGGELYKRAGGEFARMSKKTNLNPVISRRTTLETRSQSI